jgi:trans-aconitate methyltransferase
MSILDRARDLTGYDEIARLRQAQDTDWVLALAAGQAPRALADLGCGTGTLLARALERWPSLDRVVGVDGHAARVDEASARLGAAAAIRRGDLLSLPEDRGGAFDIITLTSVLH